MDKISKSIIEETQKWIIFNTNRKMNTMFKTPQQKINKTMDIYEVLYADCNRAYNSLTPTEGSRKIC